MMFAYLNLARSSIFINLPERPVSGLLIVHTFSSTTVSSAITVSLGTQATSLLSTVALVEVDSRFLTKSFPLRLVLEDQLDREGMRCIMLTGRPTY